MTCSSVKKGSSCPQPLFYRAYGVGGRIGRSAGRQSAQRAIRLRQHIFKENNILFKMAESVLSAADDDALNDSFTEVERERELSDLHQRFTADVARWEEAMT